VQGQVTSNDIVAVNGKTPGILEAVYVTEGDVVKQGHVLARVDHAVAQSSLKELENSLAVAEDLFQRQKGLWEQKIGSEVQYINAKASRDGLQRSIATLKAQLNQTVIVAPISGTVDNVNARVGESSQHPEGLFRIVNLSQLKITGDVAEAYQPYLKNGASVEVEFPELHLVQTGKISFVSSIINPTSRTITLEAKVPNTSKLRPNMIAKLRVNDQTLPTTITIDQNLVQTSEQGDVVYVVAERNGKPVAESRKVQTGLSYNGQVQIKSGLAVGDKLITMGQQDVSDGQAVTF
jgi:RND family efflux transporter MFP subunit